MTAEDREQEKIKSRAAVGTPNTEDGKDSERNTDSWPNTTEMRNAKYCNLSVQVLKLIKVSERGPVTGK